MPKTAPSSTGTCDTRFAAVREQFERNFAELEEVGAAVTISVDGKTVVDLWGGVADRQSGRLWKADTIVPAFSVTKGLTALCMHMLIDRGQIDPAAPVARYWPEFAAGGKEDVTIAMVLGHQAGLPYWQEPLPERALLDWDLVTSRLAAEAPIWEPGTRHGYHAMTIGFIAGEVLRRVDGRTLGRFLREEAAGPLSADAWIGLPEAEEQRLAAIIPAPPNPNSPFFRKLMAEPGWGAMKMFTNTGGDAEPGSAYARARRAAENPATGGIMSARALARLYTPLSLDGAVDDVRIVAKEALAGMRVVRSAGDVDEMLRVPTTFTLGFSKSWGSRELGPGEHVMLGEQAFGAPGMGGSIGFADGQARMAFGYVMNRHGGGIGLNERGQGLVDAAYRALGFTQSAACGWTA